MTNTEKLSTVHRLNGSGVQHLVGDMTLGDAFAWMEKHNYKLMDTITSNDGKTIAYRYRKENCGTMYIVTTYTDPTDTTTTEKKENKNMKTNCKKALENLRAYILNNTDTTNYEELKQPETFKEAAQIIIDRFYDEYMHGYNTHRNHQEVFIDWLQGLPSVFDSCYYYNRSAVDDLGAILEESESEKSKYSEEKAADTLSRIIYREITKATGRY